MIDVRNIKNKVLFKVFSGEDHTICSSWSNDIYVPLWSVTIWDKKFKNVDRFKQKKINPYKYILSADMIKLERQNGSVFLLSTGNYKGYTTEELAGDYLAEGEVVTIPWGGYAFVKYHKGKFVTSDNRIATSSDTQKLSNRYLYYFMLSKAQYLDSYVYRGTGLKHPEMLKVLDLLIPLPDIATQNNIVEKLDNIFAILDKIDCEQKSLLTLKDKLNQRILELGIKGFLVKQKADEGTGESLLKELYNKKAALKDANVLKGRKSKPVLEIEDDEIPYNLPSNWVWTRLGNVCEIFGRIGFRGYTTSDIVEQGHGAITISPSNINDNGQTNFDFCTYISWEKYKESPEIMIFENDLLVVKTGSSFGKCGIVKKLPEKATINPQLAVLKYVYINKDFLNIVLNSFFSQKQFKEFVVGTAIPTFSQEKLANLIIPLPPIEEQRRIVERVDELLLLTSKMI